MNIQLCSIKYTEMEMKIQLCSIKYTEMEMKIQINVIVVVFLLFPCTFGPSLMC